MAEYRARRSTASRVSTAGTLRVALPAALLVSLATAATIGQAPTPTFSISDVTVSEGNSGTTTATFVVSLANPNGAESRVSFTMNDGTATSGLTTTPFFSGGLITIADNGAASPYPATINVSGLGGPAHTVSLAVNGLTHPSPDEVDVLVVGPGSQSLIVQADGGGSTAVTNVNYLLADRGTPMPGAITPGVYQPVNAGPDDPFPGPAPGGPHANPGPAGSATLSGTSGNFDANGTWRVYVADDTAGNQGSIRSLTLIVDVPDPGSDYLPAGGQLVFSPGTTSLPVTVTIFGDTTIELNDTFVVDLVGPFNALLGDGQAIGSITNDDSGGGGAPPTAVNDRYVFVTDSIVRTGANGVLSNDLPNGGGPMTAVLVEGPKNGSLTLQADGGFTYRSNSSVFVSDDTFTYRAVNAFGASLTAVVTITDTVLTPQPPTNLRVESFEEFIGNPVNPRGRVMTVRSDQPPGAPPNEYALAGGTQPGETLAFVTTGSAYPIYTFTAPPGSFFIRMHSLLGTSQSGPSNEVLLHVNTTVTPSAPANLLGAVDGSNLTLAWKNTFLGGIATNTFLRVTGDASVTIPLGATETFTYSPVPAGQQYSFEVLNANAGGVSTASNKVTLAFPGACSPPQMPTDFLLYVEGLILGAIWDLPANGAAPNGYLLHVTSPLFTGSVPIRTRNIRAQVVPGTYTASVEATSACGASARTPEQTVVVP